MPHDAVFYLAINVFQSAGEWVTSIKQATTNTQQSTCENADNLFRW